MMARSWQGCQAVLCAWNLVRQPSELLIRGAPDADPRSQCTISASKTTPYMPHVALEHRAHTEQHKLPEIEPSVTTNKHTLIITTQVQGLTLQRRQQVSTGTSTALTKKMSRQHTPNAARSQEQATSTGQTALCWQWAAFT